MFRYFITRVLIITYAVLVMAIAPVFAQTSDEPSTREALTRQAKALKGFVKSTVAKRFLAAVHSLPAAPESRLAYRNRSTREVLTETEANSLPDSTLEAYERIEMDEEFYYLTRYGTPVAFVRPLDLIGRAGLDTLDDARIVDFGFGSIGHLRMLAANGASVHGIDVDKLLGVLYSELPDTERVARASNVGDGPDGEITLHFGRFPADPAIVDAVGSGFDVFVSKNTLKNGYIHPAEEVDPKMLVHLGVDDETFVRTVHGLLSSGGFFMIYNLCPPQSDEEYVPWADGRSPFTQELFESVGFEIIAYNKDDTVAAREMGKRLGWGEQILETDLFGTYTLVRKR
jgi:hypothetical protein